MAVEESYELVGVEFFHFAEIVGNSGGGDEFVFELLFVEFGDEGLV